MAAATARRVIAAIELRHGADGEHALDPALGAMLPASQGEQAPASAALNVPAGQSLQPPPSAKVPGAQASVSKTVSTPRR